MLAGKDGPRAAEPRRHLVTDEQGPVSITELTNFAKVPGRGGDHPRSALDHRLDDDRRHLPLKTLQRGAQGLSACELTLRVGEPQLATVTVRARDLLGGK